MDPRALERKRRASWPARLALALGLLSFAFCTPWGARTRATLPCVAARATSSVRASRFVASALLADSPDLRELFHDSATLLGEAPTPPTTAKLTDTAWAHWLFESYRCSVTHLDGRVIGTRVDSYSYLQ